MTDIIQPSILPGFMELLPKDQLMFNKIKDIIENEFKKYGFLPLDTPVIEKGEILFSKGGGETQKQVYKIQSNTRDMGLRFDLTVPLARYVSQHYNDLVFPFKRYHIAKVYRGERNQRGRYREFYQCDIDSIGDGSLDLKNDSQMIFVLYNIFKKLNIGKFTFNINNRKILNGFLESLEIIDRESVLRIIDKIEKMENDKFRKELLEIIDDDLKADKVFEFISVDESNEEKIKYLENLNIKNELFKVGILELKEVYEYMKVFGIEDENIMINLSITRGLDYYTSTVMETFLDNDREIGSICSGGRYDNLASNFTKRKLPGVGFSIGLTRLFYQLNDKKLLNIEYNNFIDALIIPMEGCEKEAINLANDLQNNAIRTQVYFEKSKMGKKFSYADKLDINKVIVIGEDEIKNKLYSLKDMNTGKNLKLCLNDLILNLK